MALLGNLLAEIINNWACARAITRCYIMYTTHDGSSEPGPGLGPVQLAVLYSTACFARKGTVLYPKKEIRNLGQK
jgi:hypothetical protein